MNGAESLVSTLVDRGVDICFANPGTSEMHFVAALDRIPGVRCVLGLFEGVVTGAADGYWRMAGRPAATRPGTTRSTHPMRGNFRAAAWRLTAFLAICAVGTFILLAVFAQFRFGAGKTYQAVFSNVSGLKDGDLVRIAGVEVGKVQAINVNPDATVTVEIGRASCRERVSSPV